MSFCVNLFKGNQNMSGPNGSMYSTYFIQNIMSLLFLNHCKVMATVFALLNICSVTGICTRC